ncbi:hypothetical protein CRYUN_Cryun37aG0065700 [Craigia yunnanensis]
MSSSFFGLKDNKDRKELKKNQLRNLFQSYANQGQGRLSQVLLKDAFEHLGAPMPHKQAEEAMNVADKNKDKNINTADELEFKSLVEYAYNNNFGDSF